MNVQTFAGLEGGLVSLAVIAAMGPLNVESYSTCWSNLKMGYRISFGSIGDCGYIS